MKTISSFLLIAGLLGFSINSWSQPVAVNDNFAPVIQVGDTAYFNVVQNDSDPGGVAFKICEVIWQGFNDDYTFFNDTSIWWTANTTYELVFKYRLCQIPNTTILSNWAYVTVNPTRNINYPVARNDSATISPGDSIYVDILANDFDPNGDSIYIKPTIWSFTGEGVPAEVVGNQVKIKLPFEMYGALNKGYSRLKYYISDTLPVLSGTSDMGLIYVKIENGNYFDYLDINNIKARFSCFGNHFWDMVGNSEFYFPNGANTTASFANAVWIGGKSYGADTVLHIAAERFRSNGGEFAWGPVSNSYDLAYDQKWFRTWKLTKNEIEYHKQNWWQPGYVPIDNIMEWPGNGNISLGQAPILASFHDNNNNGVYEPMQGDYPYIRGDQAIFFIFNDDRLEHQETGGAKMGIEIQGMAYAFDNPQIPALWNTVFLHYDIINRSDTDYHETYIGNWTDADLGYPTDDYIACNVEESYFYNYNGEAIDGSGQLYAFGQNPPFSAIKILGGPLMDADNLDNPDGGCDESVNGTFFGDSIIDNERLGMTIFRCYNNAASGPMIGPQNDIDYYNYLQGLWRDGSPMKYGGTGYINDPSSTGITTSFMFPGSTDPCGWGNGGIPMPVWSEESEGNPPGDRRAVGISGPFTLGAGQTQSIDYAYIMGWGNSAVNFSAFDTLNAYSQYLTELYESGSAIFIGIESEASKLDEIRIYPNPARDIINLDAGTGNSTSTYFLLDITGKIYSKGKINPGTTNQVSLSGMAQGVYFLRVSGQDGSKTFKVLKL